jgi:hypothetical protein
MKTKIYLVFVLAGLLSTGQAQTIIHVPGDYPTIQAGIDAASDGNVVLVDEGIYYENINFKGKAIRVTSLFWEDGDTNHINNTIISGAQPTNPDSNCVVMFISAEDTNSVICGFTISDGTGIKTGTMTNGWIEGGGVFCSSTCPIIEYNHIINNKCEDFGVLQNGGGISIYNAGSLDDMVIIRNNRISGNYCSTNQIISFTAGPMGGGISCFPGKCIIENNTISENYTYYGASTGGFASGGGIAINHDDMAGLTSAAVIIGNIISNNSVECASNDINAWGGGIYLYNCLESIISNNTIDNNTVEGNLTGKGAGIGIINNREKFILDGNIFKNNHATLGGGLSVNIVAQMEITNSVFMNNDAVDYGGAVWLQSDSIDNSGSDFIMANNTVAFNQAGIYGGAIVYTYMNPLIAFNNIIYENESTGRDTEIELWDNSTAFLYNNELDSNKIWGNWEGEGNFYADPCLCEDGIHLTENSPCIDMGIAVLEINGTYYNCPMYDIDGEQRFDPDVGADEWYYVTGIANPTLPPDDHVQIIPNPVKGEATVKFTLKTNGYTSLCIYDMNGRKIRSLLSKYLLSGDNEVTLDASGVKTGTYLCVLKADQSIITSKFIIVK